MGYSSLLSIPRLRSLAKNPLARNAFSLYVVQFAEYLLPMLTVPFLSRRLGPGPWGIVIYAQSFSNWMGLLLEYGFTMSATRHLARIGGGEQGREARARVLSTVFGASIALSVLALGAAAVCAFEVPLFRENRTALLLATLIAITQGTRPFWYFQGTENLGPISALNLTGRIFTTFGVFILIHSPADALWVLKLQLLSSAAILLLSVVIISRRETLVRPTWRLALEGLREGWSLFVTRSAITLYTVANTFILGWFVPAAQVTMFGFPERLNRAALAVTNPLLGAFYPRIANLAATDERHAARAARKGFKLVVGLGTLVGMGMILFAPFLIRKGLGPGYEEAIPVFRILALLAPLISANSMLGAQWMIPLGLEAAVNRLILTAGVLNVFVAMLLARAYGPIGMAICAVLAETVVLIGLVWTLERTGKGFWRRPVEAVAAG